MKPVKIQIAKQIKWNQPPKMLDWDGYPTIISGLYLIRPLMLNEEPAPRGWDICHQKSGYRVNPQELKSEKKAREFIKILESKKLNWDVTYEEYRQDYKIYLQAVRETWEAMNDNP